MSRGRTDLAISYTMDRFADGNCNIAGDYISRANGDTTTLNLGRTLVMGQLTNNAGTLRFPIPTFRILPSGTTINKIQFSICCRAGNANSTGMYIVKKTSGGSDYASFDSSSSFSFYDGGNTSRSLSQSSITKSIYGNTSLYIEMAGGNYYFCTNSTNAGYVNNQPVCVELNNIIITLNTPYYSPQYSPAFLPINSGASSNVADYVESTGTTSGWSWEKWASGKVIAWTKDLAISSLAPITWVSPVNCRDTTFSIPSGIFTAAPSVTVTSTDNQWGVFSANATSATSVSIRFITCATAISAPEVNVYAIGT